jgi:hypothetical protein
MNNNNTRLEEMNNSTICILPWIHQYIDLKGDVKLCGFGKNSSLPLGNIREQSFSEIWNNENFKKIRLEMLNGKRPDFCENCYKHEDLFPKTYSSYRNITNKEYEKYLNVIDETLEDGSLPLMKIRFVDINWSNICNLKCRMCRSSSSSSIALEEKYNFLKNDVGYEKAAGNSNDILLAQVKEQLPFIETIHFVGGEPLLMKEHYEILEYLIELDRTDISLRYNSNGTVLTFKTKNILDYWKQFNKIIYVVSIDSWDQRLEYARHGCNWESILFNIRKIKKECPHIKIWVHCVVNIWNCLTIVEFLYELEKEGIFIPNDDNLTLEHFISPEIFKITVLPIELRLTAIEKIENYIKEKSFSEEWSWIRHRLYEIVEYMKQPQEKELEKELKLQISIRDKIRKESFVEVFPEMKEWYESIDTGN